MAGWPIAVIPTVQLSISSKVCYGKIPAQPGGSMSQLSRAGSHVAESGRRTGRCCDNYYRVSFLFSGMPLAKTSPLDGSYCPSYTAPTLYTQATTETVPPTSQLLALARRRRSEYRGRSRRRCLSYSYAG